MNPIFPRPFSLPARIAAICLLITLSGCASTDEQKSFTGVSTKGASTGISVRVDFKSKGGKPLPPDESFMKSALFSQKVMKETTKPGLTEQQMTENVIRLVRQERAAGRLGKADRVTIQPAHGQPIIVD